LDLHVLKGLTAVIADLHKLQELERVWPRPRRIALARVTYSYPEIYYHRRHRNASDICGNKRRAILAARVKLRLTPGQMGDGASRKPIRDSQTVSRKTNRDAQAASQNEICIRGRPLRPVNWSQTEMGKEEKEKTAPFPRKERDTHCRKIPHVNPTCGPPAAVANRRGADHTFAFEAGISIHLLLDRGIATRRQLMGRAASRNDRFAQEIAAV
jgi:hypothetical protein